MTQAERAVEDRLLVIETKLDFLATKAELTATKSELLEQLAKVRDDLTVRIFQSFSGVVLLVVGATVVNHFWK